MIQTKRKEYEHLKEFDVKNKTFLQCLMETKRFTDEELIDEVATFTFAVSNWFHVSNNEI